MNYTKEIECGIESGNQYINQTLNALKFLMHFVGDISQPLHCCMMEELGEIKSIWSTMWSAKGLDRIYITCGISE